MTRADIDELKIVIQADDQASGKVGDLVTTLEELSKLSIDDNGTKELGENAEKTSERLNRAREALARLKDVASAGGFGSKMLSEVDAIQTKIGILENKADKLDLGKDKDVERFVNLSLQVSGLEKRLDRLHATALKEIAENAEKAKEATIETTKATKDLQDSQDVASGKGAENTAEMEAEARAFHQEVDDIISSLGELARSARLSEVMDFAKNAKEADLVKMKLRGIYEQIVNLENKNGNPKAIASLYEQAQRLEAKLKDLGNTANIGGALGKVLDKWGVKIPTVDGLLKKATTSMKKFGKEVGKSSSKMLLFPFAQVAKGAKKLTGAIGKLFTKLKTVAMYRALRGFIKMVNEGFKEGTQNAYQWSKAMNDLPQGDLGRYASTLDSLASSALYLKNAFATIAIPILNRLEPAITSLIKRFVDAINVINQFFAVLTGAETWTKALYYPKEFAEGLDQATGSAKDLKDAITILGIDEINPLNAVKEPSGGGGGLDDALDYASMFEEVATTASERWAEIFDPFKKAWETKGQGVIDSIHNALSGIKTLAKSVGDSFYEVWTNGTGQEAIEHLLGIFTGISDTIGNITRQFSVGWEFNGNGTRIIQAVADTLNDILTMWEDIATSTADWAKEVDFRPFIDGVADLTEGIESLIEPITRAISWTWENVVLVLGKWTIERGLPKAVSALGEALNAVGSALSAIGSADTSKIVGSLDDLFGFFSRNALSTIEVQLQFFTDILKVISDIADILAGKKTLKMVWLEWVEEKATRLTTIFHYLGKVWEALINLDFDAVEENVRNAFNPTNTPYYLYVTGKIKEVEDERKAKAKRLEFNAFISEVDDTDILPNGGNLAINGITFAHGGGTPNLGKLNFDTVDIDVNANMTNAVDKIPQSQKRIDNMNAMLATKTERFDKNTGRMTATLATKTERFDKNTGRMTANLNGKRESFSTTTGDMTARLTGKSETFDKVTSNMTAKLAEKQEKFGKTTDGMTAHFEKKNEGFSKTTDGMTAKFTKQTDGIPKDDKYITNVVAYVKSLAKSSNFTGLSLSGNVTASQVGSQSKVAVALKKRGGIFTNGFWKNIPQYSAGTLNAGSMFIAGEAGAELVGNVGGRTEVLNQSQIAQAMASSMMQANASQNAILQEQNSLLRQLLQKDTNVTAILSTSSLIEGANRQNKRTGRTVIPVGV